MPGPIPLLAMGAAGLYALQRGWNGLFDPEQTPAPTAPRAPNVAQQSIEVADRGVQYNQPSLPTPATAPRTAPVATPGEAAAPAPAEAANTDATDRLRALQANNPQAAEPTDDPDADRNRRLAQFGFAMAASRNPSLFGMIGEAGLAMQRGNREEREDDRRDREVDTQAEYRQAQIALARAEALYNQDPNNPRNQAYLAQARYAMARAARGSGEGGGAARDGTPVPMINPETGRMTFFYPRTGRAVDAPEGLVGVGAGANTPEARELERWNNTRDQLIRDLLTNEITANNPQLREQRLRAFEQTRPRPAGMPRGAQTQTQAPAQPPGPYRTLQVR